MSKFSSSIGQARAVYEEIMAVAWEPLLVVDCSDRTVIDANQAALRLYGFSRAELIDSDFGQRFSAPHYVNDIFSQHRDYVPLRFQRGRAERHIPVEMSLRYFLAGEKEYAAVALREISERIERERLDNESERKYQSLFEASPYPILILNSQGMIVDGNRCAQNYYGYEHADLIRLEWRQLDITAGALHFMSRPTLLGARQHQRSDGSGFMAEVMLSYFRLHGQSLILALVRDVTEHWRTFQQLQESEARWRFAIEGNGDALVDWPIMHDGSYYVSPSLSLTLGYDPELDVNLTSEDWLRRVEPEDRRILETAISAHIAGQEPVVHVEFRMREQSGDYRWMALWAKIIVSGQVQRLIGAVRDIHAERMRHLREIADRGRLFRLERMAAAGEMLSALAHEVNQPLTAVSNYSALVIRQFAGGHEREMIERSLRVISEQALRAGEIVRRIREFVRRSEPNLKHADLNALIRRVAAWCQNEAAAAGIQIRLDLDGLLHEISLDILQIEQVVFNLIRNGLEAMSDDQSENPRLLVVSTHVAEGAVLVRVRDFGVGLDRLAADKMFEPFVSSKPEGMGMGLAICRTIIESHGGEIWAESPADGRGTLFSFTLGIPRVAQTVSKGEAHAGH